MILVTGAAGFIGSHVLAKLLGNGLAAMGLDNFNAYYDPQLKRDRVAALLAPLGALVEEGDCADGGFLASVFERHGITRVIHLAAQAGVRYSLVNPGSYVQANLVGFANILECCRHAGVDHLVFASSSSVYGNNRKMPWDEADDVSHPVSLYAATKVANELLAHSYAHLYGLPCTGLRFFTVYGPWGRPDMAPFIFSRAIRHGEPLKMFNHGRMLRDFTYIDDIAEAVCRVAQRPAVVDPGFDGLAPVPATSHAPYRLFNIGNQQPVQLTDFIELLEKEYGRKAVKELVGMQPGDVPATFASTRRLDEWIGFAPGTSLADGLHRFASWYRSYYPDTTGVRDQ